VTVSRPANIDFRICVCSNALLLHFNARGASLERSVASLDCFT
jgi:hypothetical protein